VKKIAEEISGGLTGIVLSIGIYLPEIATHAINSIFVLVNASLAVLISHSLKKNLERKDRDENINKG
jgi:hypothetical protein